MLDGDALYVDRNGNGDLTDAGERLAPTRLVRHSEERPDLEVMRNFELSCWHAAAEPVLTCGPEVQRFYIHQLVPRADWHDQGWVQYYQKRPFDVALTTAGRAQRAQVRFAASAKEAPVLHFDGPKRLALSSRFDPDHFRPGEPSYLAVELHTPGWNATVRTELEGVPADVHPVAEIEYPPGRPGEGPTRVRVELKERC